VAPVQVKPAAVAAEAEAAPPPEAALPHPAAVAPVAPAQAKPAAVAAPSRPEAPPPPEAALPHPAGVTPVAPVQVKPAAVAAPSRPEAEAAPPPDVAPPPEAAHPPHTAAVTPAAPPQVKPGAVAALVVAPALEAEIAAASRFPVEVREGPEGLPPGTHVVVIGLPTAVTLSGGQPDDNGGWVVPLSALENLKIKVPSGMAGSLAVGLVLIDNTGTVLAQRGATIRLTASVAAVPADTAPEAAPRNKTTAKGAALAEARRLAELAERSLAHGHVAEAREYFARAIDLGLAIDHPWDSGYGRRHGGGR
jgi:hypothetical protein